MQRIALIPLLTYASFSIVGLVFVIQGCGGTDNFFYECKSDPLFPDKICPGDAGAGDAADENDPGSSPQAACTASGGECIPLPEADTAGSWRSEVLQVWIGPAVDMPKDCGDGAVQYRLFDGLNAPPATCDSCTCSLKPGKCEGAPSEIAIRAGVCSDMSASTLPFGGPEGWDGSCTNDGAISGGAECPPGSGILCAQSFSFTPLPPPSGESCIPETTQIPTLGTKITEWATGALACRSSVNPYTCGDTKLQCAPKVLFPLRQCIYREGMHYECPEGFDYERRIMYPELPVDSRDCTACTCGDPEGSACVARLRLFKDGACSSEFLNQPIASLGGDCSPIFPFGLAVGSKAITDRTYMPGSCKASGGEPIGKAEGNEIGAVTFCCRRSDIFAE